MKITKERLKQIIKEALEGGIDQFAKQYEVEPVPHSFTNQQLIDFAKKISTNSRRLSPISTGRKPADIAPLEALVKLLTNRRAKEKDPKIRDEMQTVRLMVLDTIDPDGTHREDYAYKQKMRADKLSRAKQGPSPRQREELPTGAPRLRKFLGYGESLNRKQLKQMIKEELENVMGEAATTDDEHMAVMVYANASEALRRTLRGLEDGEDFEEAVQSLMDNAVGSGEESASDVAPIVRRLLNGETL